MQPPSISDGSGHSTWAREIAIPHRPPASPIISYQYPSRSKRIEHRSEFDRAKQIWPSRRGRPPVPGMVLYAQVDGDTTWLNIFEFNASDEPRPAVDAIVEVGAGDVDGIRDEDIDIDIAEPVLDVSGSDRRIPARSVRRRVVPVKTRSERSWYLKSSWGDRNSSSDSSEQQSIDFLPSGR